LTQIARGTFAAIVAVAVAFVTVPASKPKIYGNAEFGIVVTVPDGALLCRIPLCEHDHGPYMLLDPTSQNGCHDLEHNRSIDVFASYNVAADTKRLSDFLNEQCVSVGGRACTAAPADLRVFRLQSAAAKVDRSDGWIDVFVVTQVGDLNSRAPGVNYAFTLRTTTNELRRDLTVFRTVLRTIRLSPPAQ
jgi:hypothetical protein